MNEITYGVVKECYSLGNQNRVSYGIAAFSNAETDGTATMVCSVRDITSDLSKLTLLVEQCNRLHISLLHLHEVVDEFFDD